MVAGSLDKLVSYTDLVVGTPALEYQVKKEWCCSRKAAYLGVLAAVTDRFFT